VTVRVAAAAILLALDLAAFTWLARRARRLPLPLSGVLGLALLVAWQSVVAWALSWPRAVGAVSLGVAACVPPAVAVLLARRDPGGLRGAASAARRAVRAVVAGRGLAALAVLPLAVALGVAAFSYAPSNWDSMTYHLSRVAHWLQHGSVEAYETGIYRQVLYAPGAEYLVLLLQAVSGTDRLAAAPQLVAWLLVVASGAPLARLAGAPRRVAAWAGPLVAGTPMMVLQATSTQNDLVAAALALAVVAACLPFLHRRPRLRGADVVVAAVALSAAFLVKATALVATAPFVVAATVGLVRALASGRGRSLAPAMAGALAVAAAVAGPQAFRMASADARAEALTAPFVFPLSGDAAGKLESLRLAATRHLPRSVGLHDDLAGRPRAFPPFHEDLAANPVQALVAVLTLVVGVVAGFRAPRRARWAGAGLLLAWVAFQVSFRPNPWVSRLETPLFALLPLGLGLWSGEVATLGRWTIPAAGLASVALGLVAAQLNPARPVLGAFSPRTPEDDYYVNRPDQRPMHDAALRVALDGRCTRIGLVIGGDSYDYPLTWRAMQLGLEVRHVRPGDRWPCVLVSDQGMPAEVAGDPAWQPVLRLVAREPGGERVAGGIWYRRP
jgi:hypothetical protein